MKLLYHRSPNGNVGSILAEGLVPRHNFVSLSEKPDSWWPEHALFSVDIDAFRRDFPSVHVTTWLPELDEICVWGAIPPEYVKLAPSGAGEKPGSVPA